jgi:peptidoglycan/xylan/chitin deacetylase (PgdA/CDA1 family)
VVVGALSLTTAAILANRPTAPAQVALATATTAPATTAGAVIGVGPEGPRRDVPDPPVATDVPAGHGGPPLGCPGTLAGAPLAKVVHHGSRTDKVVALTFDDGYDAENTLKILAILQGAKVNATFFPIGVAVKKEQAAWKAVALAGYPIANHTYDHKNLDGMCEASQLAELVRQEAVITKDLGVTVQPYMRPPGGNYDVGTRLAAAEDGEHAVVLWDIDTRDWAGLSKRAITARAIVGTNGSIVIMHTFVANTASALPAIIASYRARGFTFVTVGQLLGIDGPVPFP